MANTPSPALPRPTTPVPAPAPLQATGEAREAVTALQDSGGVSRQQVKDVARGIGMEPLVAWDLQRTRREYQATASQGVVVRQSATQTLRVLSEIQNLPAPVVAQATRLRRSMGVSKQRAESRRKEFGKLQSGLRKNMWLIFGAALLIAAVADVLSIFDFGWVISWAIIPFTFVMSRRINRINRTGDAIVAAQGRASREVAILHQRLGPALAANRRTDLSREIATQKLIQVGVRFGSYLKSYVISTIGVQVAELIPFIDILPMYLGQVVRVIVDQYGAYRTARRVLLPLQRTYILLEKLEAFEVSSLARQLDRFVMRYQQERLGALNATPEPAPLPEPVAPLRRPSMFDVAVPAAA